MSICCTSSELYMSRLGGWRVAECCHKHDRQASQCVCLQSVVILMHVAMCLWNGCMHVQHFNMSDLSQERMMYEANRLRLGAHRQ